MIQIPTSTFDKKFIVKENKAADVLIKGLFQKKISTIKNDIDVVSELRKSLKLIRKSYKK